MNNPFAVVDWLKEERISIKNIYIVEDHPLMQRLLREYLEGISDLHVCGATANIQAALDQLPTVAAQLVLVDVSLPGRSGIDLVRTLQAQEEGVPCLILSSYEDAHFIAQALAAGARGYVFKGDPLALVAAIQQVLQGDIALSDAVRKKLAEWNE